MRASRLISLLLLLQARRRCTAEQLAEELGVSVRTIYRDVDELHAAGVPVYTQAGRGGGYSLVNGYQTRLTGLTPAEAETLLLIDLSRPFSALGLGPDLFSARLKLAAAMPASLRDRARSVAGWVHLDLPGWFEEAELPPALPVLAAAVLRQRRVSFGYGPPGRLRQRQVEPLGLVLKGRSWYLVARHGQRLLTYAVGRIQVPEVTDEPVVRPEGFDLAETWRTLAAAFEQGLPLARVRVRVRPDAVARLRQVTDSRTRQQTDWAGQAGPGGWLVIDVAFERIEYARQSLLGLGSAVEVLEPEELRRDVVGEVRALCALYPGIAAGDGGCGSNGST